MPKKRRGISLYGKRFSSLVNQLMADGYSQAELSRLTGLSQSTFSRWSKPENFPQLSDISGSIIETVTKKLGIRPEFFTDDYPDDQDRPYRLYLFSAEKQKRQLGEILQSNKTSNETQSRLLDVIDSMERAIGVLTKRVEDLEGKPAHSRRKSSS